MGVQSWLAPPLRPWILTASTFVVEAPGTSRHFADAMLTSAVAGAVGTVPPFCFSTQVVRLLATSVRWPSLDVAMTCAPPGAPVTGYRTDPGRTNRLYWPSAWNRLVGS